MHIAEFTLHAKPGHFQDVADTYSAFADRDAADAVNSDPQFADFNDRVAPLLASPSERVELQLLHQYVKS